MSRAFFGADAKERLGKTRTEKPTHEAFPIRACRKKKKMRCGSFISITPSLKAAI
jgi:hypothetical protein